MMELCKLQDYRIILMTLLVGCVSFGLCAPARLDSLDDFPFTSESYRVKVAPRYKRQNNILDVSQFPLTDDTMLGLGKRQTDVYDNLFDRDGRGLNGYYNPFGNNGNFFNNNGGYGFFPATNSFYPNGFTNPNYPNQNDYGAKGNNPFPFGAYNPNFGGYPGFPNRPQTGPSLTPNSAAPNPASSPGIINAGQYQQPVAPQPNSIPVPGQFSGPGYGIYPGNSSPGTNPHTFPNTNNQQPLQNSPSPPPPTNTGSYPGSYPSINPQNYPNTNPTPSNNPSQPNQPNHPNTNQSPAQYPNKNPNASNDPNPNANQNLQPQSQPQPQQPNGNLNSYKGNPESLPTESGASPENNNNNKNVENIGTGNSNVAGPSASDWRDASNTVPVSKDNQSSSNLEDLDDYIP